MSAVNLEQKCIEAGLKMTEPRRVILSVLSHAHDHPSVEEVYTRAKKKDSSISMATVYRTLGLLDELGLVFRHEFNDTDHARYEVNIEHHHHLIDVDTGKVVEFQNEQIEEMKQKIAEDLGYELVECRLELYGKKLKK
jgi:Fur family ferric uptake transcriptional regulator